MITRPIPRIILHSKENPKTINQLIQHLPQSAIRHYQRLDSAQKLTYIRNGSVGKGMFAGEHINRNTIIIEYIGEVISREEELERTKNYEGNGWEHRYFLSMNENTTIDATMFGNDSRFINHGCYPNANYFTYLTFLTFTKWKHVTQSLMKTLLRT